MSLYAIGDLNLGYSFHLLKSFEYGAKIEVRFIKSLVFLPSEI